MRGAASRRRQGWATAAGIAAGGLAYFLTLLDYRTDVGRTADGVGYASNFFDLQGRAFLAGRLDVPSGSLGIEGFLRNGHEYMYFPPFPALLRLPVLMTTKEFDGQLTVLSMALAFVLLAVMTSKLVWLVRELLLGHRPLGRFEAATWAVFLALATGGTVLTFNASLPWVYDEVYAWAVPLVIGSMYWMLRVLRSPDADAIWWLGGFALCTILTRTTGGWAVCLATIGIGVWLLTGRLFPERRRAGWGVLALGASALAVGIGYNLVKFGHPYLFPLQDQRWTALNAHRREALEVNGGTITGPQFFETSFVNYFRPDGIRFVDYFPWITLPAEPARAYGGAFIDQSYRTGSVTAFMPLLLLLTIVAALVIFRPGVDRNHRLLRIPFVAGVLVTGGIMGYGYLAYRYTCEFVPALVLGGAIALCPLIRWLSRRSRPIKAAALAVLVLGTGFSMAANMATGYYLAAITDGGSALTRYLELQRSFGGSGPSVTVSDDPPSGGSTDDLHIQGDCDRLYLNTGDDYVEWQLVERRSSVIVATLAPDFGASSTQVARIDSREGGEVIFQTNNDHEARVVLHNDTGTYRGPWFSVLSPGVVRIGIGDHPELGYAQVGSTPGGFVGYLRSFDYDDDWFGAPDDIDLTYTNSLDLEDRGVSFTSEPGLDPTLCTELSARAVPES